MCRISMIYDLVLLVFLIDIIAVKLKLFWNEREIRSILFFNQRLGVENSASFNTVFRNLNTFNNILIYISYNLFRRYFWDIFTN